MKIKADKILQTKVFLFLLLFLSKSTLSSAQIPEEPRPETPPAPPKSLLLFSNSRLFLSKDPKTSFLPVRDPLNSLAAHPFPTFIRRRSLLDFAKGKINSALSVSPSGGLKGTPRPFGSVPPGEAEPPKQPGFGAKFLFRFDIPTRRTIFTGTKWCFDH